MSEHTVPDSDALRQAFEQAGQGHVFGRLDQLEEERRQAFLSQLAGIDLRLLDQLIAEMREDHPVATLDLERLEPAAFLPLPLTPGSRRKETRARAAGEELLGAGKVAALVVAGGQGSRLGFDGPKGCFPIGPVSNCSLFEWHFAKVLASARRHGARIPILVLTSMVNHQQTREFLAENAWFGMPEEDVLLFRQGVLPAVDRRGRLLLSREDSLFLSPDGHGGVVAALDRENVLAELDQRGIEEIFYFQVDNPLAKVLDPAFLGHHVLARSQISSKIVAKRDAGEKVGVFARAGRRTGIVEYSDLPAELMERRDDEGTLLFRAGNIAIHVISTRFIRELCESGKSLPFHRALKAVPHLDPEGNLIQPSEPNAVKFETFVFDAIPLARRTLVVEASRAEEFSPVKNRSGADSPESARRDLIQLFRNWVTAAGFSVNHEEPLLEISPLFSLDQEQFVAKIRKQRMLTDRRLLLS